MKKLGSTLAVLLLYYVLPLIGDLSLLGHWKIIVLMLVGVLIWTTQPSLSIQESKAQKTGDRMTVWLIIGLAWPSNAVSLMEWAYWQDPPLHSSLGIVNWTGLVFMVGGLALRIKAIRTLDKFFTATVQIKDDHRLVTSGVYRFLRHPSYTGAYMCYLGTALWLGVWTGLAAAALFMGIAFYFRIAAEERALEGQFGKAYQQYASSTWRMAPWIW